ncbi:MAG: hypothetical protein RLY93_12475 [Sumerlaeia bacterium]
MSAGLYHYSAYGLRIASEFELPVRSTEASGGAPDLRLVSGCAPAGIPLAEGHITPRGDVHEVTFGSVHAGRFVIRGGCEIVVDGASGETALGVVRAFLLGAAMGIALWQRGFLVLHGSALATPEGARVFLGGRGAGKSTLAAAAVADGRATLLSDDIVAIQQGPAGPCVLPGFPVNKLDPSALAALAVEADDDQTPLVHSKARKRLYAPPGASSPQEAVPLFQIMLLEFGGAAEGSLEHLGHAEANRELLVQTYHHLRPLIEASPETRRANFVACSDLSQLIPVSRLRRASDLASLSRTVGLALAGP